MRIEKNRMVDGFAPSRSTWALPSVSPSLRSLFVLLILSPCSSLTLAGERGPLEHGHGPAAKGLPPQRRVEPDGGVEDVRRRERRERGRVGGVAQAGPACGERPHSSRCGVAVREGGGKEARGTETGAREKGRERTEKESRMLLSVLCFLFLPPLGKCEPSIFFRSLASPFFSVATAEEKWQLRARASRPPPLLLQQRRRPLPPLQQQPAPNAATQQRQQQQQVLPTAGLLRRRRGGTAAAASTAERPMAASARLLPMLARQLRRPRSPSKHLSAASAGTSTTRVFASVSFFPRSNPHGPFL